jgi:anaerobic selenocysteine-containing dehydrogenase
MPTVRSFCRVCTAVCGILVDIDGDRVVAVHGDGEHPFSHGYTCPKGRALPQIHHHPDRLEHPQMRIDGTLRDTTWKACLDDLCTKLRDTIDRYGPESVGINFGTGVGMDAVGYRLAQSLHAAIGTPAKFSPLTIDGTAKVLMSELMGGSSALTGRPDYDNAMFMMLIGSNPVVSHGHTIGLPNPRGAIRDLTRHAEVWVVDPRYTETARLAAHHLAPRPGTDYAVLAYLVRELLRDGVKTSAQDVDVLAAAVEPFVLGHASAISDVPEAELERLLRAVRRAGRIAIDTGTGVTMSPSANVTQWLSWALLIITDSMNRPGGIWFHPGYVYQLESVELPITPPEGRFGPGPRSRPETQAFLREWPCAALPDEIDARNIRAFLNLGGSMLTAVPDAGSLLRALRKLDVLATTEILPNETTAVSTHLLPTKGQLERPDVTLWDFLSPRISAQHTDALVAPAGQRRSMWWVLAEIGRRLGHELADTNAAGVTDDQKLIVRSEHGELTGVARVDASVRRGAVSVPHGHAAANVNLLTSKDDIDLVTGMTRYSGVPVSLHPA